jgi:hypothetical protein
MKEKESDLNNKKIFYRMIGNGPAVVLYMGLAKQVGYGIIKLMQLKISNLLFLIFRGAANPK